MNKKEFDSIRKRCEKASGTYWKLEGEDVIAPLDHMPDILVGFMDSFNKTDTDFVVNSLGDTRKLLDEVKRLSKNVRTSGKEIMFLNKDKILGYRYCKCCGRELVYKKEEIQFDRHLGIATKCKVTYECPKYCCYMGTSNGCDSWYWKEKAQ